MIRLKDRDLEKQLSSFGNGDFSCCLNAAYENRIPEEDTFIVRFGGLNKKYNIVRLSAKFSIDEIEEIPEYNPNTWNEFPSVTPPDGKLLRVEVYIPGSHDGPEIFNEKIVKCCCGYYNHGYLLERDSNYPIKKTNSYHIRVRPWNN